MKQLFLQCFSQEGADNLLQNSLNSRMAAQIEKVQKESQNQNNLEKSNHKSKKIQKKAQNTDNLSKIHKIFKKCRQQKNDKLSSKISSVVSSFLLNASQGDDLISEHSLQSLKSLKSMKSIQSMRCIIGGKQIDKLANIDITSKRSGKLISKQIDLNGLEIIREQPSQMQ